MNLYYVFFSNICTYAGAIGAAIFGVMSIVVAVQQLNTPSDDKKFVEMIIAFVVAVIIFFVGQCISCSDGYIAQNYDWIKTSERNNLVRDCPEDSTMTSYCAYKWKEYRIDSTEAVEDMRKYLEKK